GGEPVTVPNLVGKDVSDAFRYLAERGLEVGKQTPMASNLPKGEVIAQRPAAEKVVRSGRKVYLTVSAGEKYLKAPDLSRKTLAEALEIIQQNGFREGTRARMPHAAARDTVLAQDPAPAQSLSSGAEINLLVSDGPAARAQLMPNLVGMSLKEVEAKLALMRVTGTPANVKDPEAPKDVVITQKPEPGSLIQPGDIVTYEIRLSGAAPAAATSQRKVVVRYKNVPLDWLKRGFQADVISASGRRQTVTIGVPDEASPFNDVGQPVTYVGDKLTVEFFVTVDSEEGPKRIKTRSYYYEGDADPVITDFPVSLPEGDSSGASPQDSPINPSL
ncbi:MAG: PASTA domain-containing protein, partial [Candidatus Hydrogenedentes bacterium]|nr:PASTA domain-containing protein [Candidatus Hydrogenedentota bacterium]